MRPECIATPSNHSGLEKPAAAITASMALAIIVVGLAGVGEVS
jgi:hypothetical protein